jgi:DNA-binding Lrp family transcriptional regulator
MVSEILKVLHEGKTFSQFEIADRFQTTPEAVMAGMEFLKKGGYVKQICVYGGCSKKCAGCIGGNTALWNSFSLWSAAE